MDASEGVSGRPAKGAVLGVDYGTVRVGLALGFRSSGLVIPLPVLPHPGSEAEVVRSLAAVARERGAERVVFGNPLHASGAPSEMSRAVGRVAAALGEALDAPVVLRDEHGTSKDAEARLASLGLRWWQYDKGRVDALAAMAIVRADLLAENPRLGLLPADPEPEAPPPRAGRKERRRRARRRR